MRRDGNKERIPESALTGLIAAFNEITLDPSRVSHDLLGQGLATVAV